MIESPEIFSSDDQGYAVLTRTDVPVELMDQASRAADSCPESAIQITTTS
jgi:ferredoxin